MQETRAQNMLECVVILCYVGVLFSFFVLSETQKAALTLMCVESKMMSFSSHFSLSWVH